MNALTAVWPCSRRSLAVLSRYGAGQDGCVESSQQRKSLEAGAVMELRGIARVKSHEGKAALTTVACGSIY
jgi:hypothetical protein